MNPTLETLALYFARIAPGLVLGVLMLFLARSRPRERIIIYLALFILFRDAMTPLGLWSFGSEGFFWIRLNPDALFLVVFGLSCAVLSLGMIYLDRENRGLFRWLRGNPLLGVLAGAVGALVVVAPLFVIYQNTPIEARGGRLPAEVIPALLVCTMLGNLLEETLFRGYVYGHLAQNMAPWKAGVGSGLVFAFCHMFLALTVTGIGYPLLVFTLWEGIIAGLVGRWGVLPSTLTHGGAIFLLSSG